MRTSILSLLQRHREGISFHGFVRRLHVSDKEKTMLERDLAGLERQGELIRMKRRYFLKPRAHLMEGTVVAVHRGYGFVRAAQESRGDIFVPGRHWGDARLGDVVEVTISGLSRKGKPEGKIARIRKKGQETYFGIYRERWGRPVVLPLDSASWEEVPLVIGEAPAPDVGAVIRVDRELRKLLEVLGHPDDPGVDMEVVIRRFDLYEEFSPEALTQAGEISGGIISPEGRHDYRDWLTITIDDEEAQDHDDAVSIATTPGGNDVLGVHIADVSHYIKPETVLDKEARLRGTSVYFPGRTLPMLPDRLSRQICSLRPKEEKLTISVVMEIDPAGEVIATELHPSIIRTRKRLSYESVWKLFQEDDEMSRELSSLKPTLFQMRSLAHRLRERREHKGSLDFEMAEPELIYAQGRPQGVAFKHQNEAHQLIEEFMLAANEAVATFLNGEGIPFFFRIHPRPLAADIADLRRLLEGVGISLPSARPVRAGDLQRVIRELEGRREERFLKRQVLKSLPLAVYSDQNQGHFALAKPVYTHFTSPIRRYSDLVVHRTLKRLLAHEPEAAASGLNALATHCSERERRVEEAERDLLEWRIHRFLTTRLGETVSAVISGFSKAGIRMDLVDYGVSGLLPFSELGGDFYAKSGVLSLKGRRTGKRFVVGQPLDLLLAAVDPIQRRVDLALPGAEPNGKRG